jgi:hypothetical protein
MPPETTATSSSIQTAAPPSTSVPPSSTSTSTSTQALPDTITADSASVIDVAERETGRWSITSPDWLAVGFDSIWVKRDNGSVMRVDPETGDVQAEIQIAPGLCQGLGAGPASVWTCSRTGDEPIAVAQIDPSNNTVVATHRVDKVSDQGRLLTVDDRVWVVSGGDRLIGIANDGTLSQPIELGMFCTDLASDGESLWVICPGPGTVARVDIADGAVVDQISLPRASAADLGEYLWVGFSGGLAQIDPTTLEVVAIYDVQLKTSGSVTEAEDSVWVRTAGSPALWRIDPTRHQFVESIDVPGLPSGGDIVVIDESVWITFYDHHTLMRLSDH